MLLVWSKAVIVEPVTNIMCSIVMDSFLTGMPMKRRKRTNTRTKWNNNETANGKKRVVASVQRLAGMLLVIGLVNGSIVIVMPVANIIR